MKDSELRGMILQKFYDKRREDFFAWSTNDTAESTNCDPVDFLRICRQLEEHRLIEWTTYSAENGGTAGDGRITADGVDVIEGSKHPPISIVLYHYSQDVSVQHSNNVQIGDSNIQQISIQIEKIIAAIDHSNATEGQKAEAKSLLKKFLEHPLVASIVGGLASTIKT